MDSYYSSCIPEPFTICGRKLKPFSLGHQIILKRFENAFLVPSKDKIKLEDLARAVLVCSNSYQDAIDMQDSMLGVAEFESILKTLKTEFKTACQFMFDYLNAGRSIPQNIKQEQGEPSYAASEAVLKFVLMAKIGYSEDRALNMPYSQAYYEFLVWQQSENLASFTDPEEDNTLPDMQKLADEFEARRHKPEVTNG